VVRLDSVHLVGPLESCNLSLKKTLLTVKYLYEARAKVVIVTSWDTVLQSNNPALKSTEALAG
jgi:phosphoglycerate kinase